jgi:hypothetical protein
MFNIYSIRHRLWLLHLYPLRISSWYFSWVLDIVYGCCILVINEIIVLSSIVVLFVYGCCILVINEIDYV